MSSPFPDHFSGHAALYARARPSYPAALYDYLAEVTPERRRAWDCATGQGQAALALAAHFDEVIATDASAEQLALAPQHPKVRYRQALAERSGLEDASIDLVAVAAAIHWFDLDAFYAEVRRVTRPGATLAIWTYGASLEIAPEVDRVVRRLADETLGAHWPAEFRHVRDGYRDLPFPFERLEHPPFAVSVAWDLPGLLGFIESWSGYQRFVASEGRGPLDAVRDELEVAWRASGGEGACEVRLPLALRVGTVA